MMTKRSKLAMLMREDLPSLGTQKKMRYYTNYNEVVRLFKLLNETIFNNKLDMPIIEVSPRCREYWGMCFGEYDKVRYKRSLCKIRIMNRWYCKQWMITILAHEMCHQYQWDILGEERVRAGKERIVSHGISFFLFKDKLAKHGISLKRAHVRKRWFKTQDFFKS